jgi:NAD(P)-dependent dehydrogenase (short-subunit alcohol dehydrogenase family)
VSKAKCPQRRGSTIGGMLGAFSWLCRMSEQTAGLSADGCDTPAPPPVIIVATGLTSGLGLETLKQLIARDGVFRIIIGSRNIPPTEQTSQLLTLRSSPRTSIEYLPLDLSSPISVTAFPKHVQDGLQDSPIDVLLLCAGMSAGERREIKLPESDLKVEETLYVNALSQVLIVNRLLRMMATTGRISIVNSGRHLNAPKRMWIDYPVVNHWTQKESHTTINCQDILVFPLKRLTPN